MKEKIFQALKTKFKNLGFGDKAFEGVAAFLATTITEEDQIETGISGVEPLLKSFQGDIDKRVNDAVTKAKTDAKAEAEEELKKKQQKQDPPTPPTGGKEESESKDSAEQLKALLADVTQPLLETVQALQTELQMIKSTKTTETRKSRLEEALKESTPKYKETILKAFARMNFDKDEDFEAYLDEVTEDAKGFVQDEADQSLAGIAKPGGIKGGKQTKEATQEELNELLGTI